MYQPYKKSTVFNTFTAKLGDTFRYFGDNTSLHGVRYVISMFYIPFYKRIFWLVILTACGVCASRVLLKVLALYSGEAVSYLVETNYLEFNTPFPAVTICEQANSDRVKAYISRHKLLPTYALFLKDVSYWSTKFCKTCSNCKNQTCMEDFVSPTIALRAKCTDLLTNCWWGDKKFSCCERFHPIETEYGICFVFNSRLTNDDESSITVNRETGLPTLVFLAKEEIGIRVHSPDDMVSVGMENILGRPVVLPMITDFEVILKAEQTISDMSVSTMSPAARGCLYEEEKPAFAQHWPFKRYSYSNCQLFCRAVAQMEACNCTHHLMPTMRGIPACTIQGLACLHKNRDALATSSCDCPMSCEEVNYKLVHMFLVRHSGQYSKELEERGIRGLVKLAELPSLRVRRDAIRQMLGLVVDIGGVGGVFFGASLLNALEIIYLFCIRRPT